MPQVQVKKRRLYSCKKWQEIMEEWKVSGLSRTAYCRAHGLTLSAFIRWQKKLEHMNSTGDQQEPKQDKKGIECFIPVTFSAGALGASELGTCDLGSCRVDILTSQGHHLWMQGPGETLAIMLKPFVEA